MLRKFKISIDGTQYLVEMEEIGAPVPTAADAVTPPAPPAAATNTPVPDAAAVPANSAAPAPAKAAACAPGTHTQTAPMPGKIVDILVAPGDTVEVNQPVMVLEAMKMESQIVAEQAGTIASINVAKQDMVNPGDPLFSLA